MTDLLASAFANLVATLRDVAPIVLVVAVFQFLVLKRSLAKPRRVCAGFVCIVFGMALFLVGLEHAIFPLGRSMAEQLTAPSFLSAGGTAGTDWRNYGWVYAFAFAIGLGTTIAEPSLIAVAIKANTISGGAVGVWGLRIAVALGVAVGIALGAFRIVTGLPIHWFIVAGYALVVIQTCFAPKRVVPLAYDSGGVTTSTVTVPLVAALGIGLAETVPGRDPLIDGFGLIAFASLFPMITVIGYAQLSTLRSRRQL